MLSSGKAWGRATSDGAGQPVLTLLRHRPGVDPWHSCRASCVSLCHALALVWLAPRFCRVFATLSGDTVEHHQLF